ncbi:MAG: Serine/threonine-protein kinase PknB [Myxococcales bacterium]|nr:Serine/threonine-protein kinase PknB [Myxococcales bacterium]
MEMTFDGPSRGADVAAGMSGSRLANGTRLNDRYEIEEFLGRTAYGEAYRARDLASGQLVAIKALAPPLIADAATMERLTREIQVAAQLDHKNIAATYGLFGAQVGADPVAYLACEYVDGQTLREMLEKKRATGRAFSLKGAYNVIAHLCNALVYAHGATVHGALTPDSVMVNSAGRVKLTDFGLARTLKPLDNFRAQVAGGSMASLAPEMMSSPESADARADIYSVGVILFELLTGRIPSDSFERPSVAAPGVPTSVDPVVEMCLRPAPDERYADAQALKESLQQALAADLAGPNAQAAAAIALPPGQRGAPNPAGLSSGPKGGGNVNKPMPVVNTPTPPPRPAPPPMASAPKPPQQPPQPQQKPPGQPPQPQQRPSLQQAAVPKSFNVDAALSAVDDTTERWLIQKDKLDFGPFHMREVRSQIESGKIVGEHVIIDTENGERRKVKDHPQLRQLVFDAEARHSMAAKEQEEVSERRKHRGRITFLLLTLVLVAGGAGGGIFWYYKNHQRVVVQKEIVHDNEYDFMKGVEISMKVDPPAVKKSRPSGGHKVSKNGKNEFSDVTNLGDASSDGGDETLDQAVVQRVMTQNFKVLVGCIAEERRRNPGLHGVDMDFIIKGTGNVAAVKVNGQTSSPLAGCMYGKMQSVAFPKFNGAKTHASFSLALK